jgi:HPr kinase/phosphorylase
MQIHASCAARDGAGVLVTGPSGSGKSDLVLRLLDVGFTLVADDQVLVSDGLASAPERLRGLLEVRGVGIVRLAHIETARLHLVVQTRPGVAGERLPQPRSHAALGLPLIEIDPFQASAARRVALALDCALGTVAQIAGAFAA